jgi:hypothetical protein
MKRLSLIMCAAIVLSLAPLTVFSQDLDQQVVPRRGVSACKADVERFCKDIKPGGGRIWACLKSNEGSLSKECKDHIAAVREKARGFNQACRADARKFCQGTRPGKGRIASCLKSHEAELSDACRAFFR